MKNVLSFLKDGLGKIWSFMAKKDAGNIFATIVFLLLSIFCDSLVFFILAVIMLLFCIRGEKDC